MATLKTIGTEDYIDITPSWSVSIRAIYHCSDRRLYRYHTLQAAVRIYLEAWESLSDKGKREAKEELLRCANLADKYVATAKEV